MAAEEVEDASLVVPRAMWYSYLLNITMGFFMLVTMLFCIGDLDTAIITPAPYIQLFTKTGSDSLATALMMVVFLLIYLGNISALATTSREVWAFSRDSGFPFSDWISKVIPPYAHPTSSHIFNINESIGKPSHLHPHQQHHPHHHRLQHTLSDQPFLAPLFHDHYLPHSSRPSLNLHALHLPRTPQTSPPRATT